MRTYTPGFLYGQPLEDLVSRLNRRDAAGTLRHLQEHSFRERDSGVAVSCLIGGQRGRDLTSCFSGVHPELIYSLPGRTEGFRPLFGVRLLRARIQSRHQRCLNAWCELGGEDLSGRCPRLRVGLPPDPVGKGTDPCSTWTPSSPHSTSSSTTSASPTAPNGDVVPAQIPPFPQAR